MMKKNISNSLTDYRGFALIATLAVLSVVVMISLAMVSLAVTVSRSGEGSEAIEEAQANARLALSEAIAKLQLTTGADTRITARADIIDDSYPKVTGVWRSWEGSDNKTSAVEIGKPTLPNYRAKLISGESNEAYQTEFNDGRFLGFLTNKMKDGVNPDDSSAMDGVSTTSSADNVRLLRSVLQTTNTSGATSQIVDEVYTEPTLVGDSGAMAWAVFGENSKATLQVKREEIPGSSDLAAWEQRFATTGFANAEDLDYDLNALPAGTTIPSINTLQLVSSSPTAPSNLDFTVNGGGLQTNVATGGWKKDLSLFSEFYDQLPRLGSKAADFPVFNLSPDKPSLYADKLDWEGLNTDDRPLLYPWADNINSDIETDIHQWHRVGAVTSWNHLANFTTEYRNPTTTQSLFTSGSSSLSSRSNFNDYAGFDYAHHELNSGSRSNRDFRDGSLGWHSEVRRYPVMARFQVQLSMRATQDADNPALYRPSIFLSPAITLWNPYNTAISFNSRNLQLDIAEPAPVKLEFTIAGIEYGPFSLAEIIGTHQNGSVKLNINNVPETLEPGQTVLFGINEVSEGSDTIRLSPGFSNRGGLNLPLLTGTSRNASEITVNTAVGSPEFQITSASYTADALGDSSISDARIGSFFTMRLRSEDSSEDNEARAGFVAHRSFFESSILTDSVIENMFPAVNDISAFPSIAFDDPQLLEGVPFLTTTIAHRCISPVPGSSGFTHLNSKGSLQAHPASTYSESGFKTYDTSAFASSNPSASDVVNTGTNHPVNTPYLNFMDVIGQNSTGYTIPQFDPSDNSTYVVTDYTPADGQNKSVMIEVPQNPLNSLAQLQHFYVTKNKPLAPYQINLIGNSSAHPIFAANEIDAGYLFPADPNSENEQKTAHMVNDDSYMLNKLLFDDWFFSSLAPDRYIDPSISNYDTVFRDSVGTTMTSFFNGTQRLSNRLYSRASHVSSSNSQSLTASLLAPIPQNGDPSTVFSYEHVASNILVEGMFNVNSTSVEAWKAFLKGGRGENSLSFDSGNTVNLISNPSGEIPFPRTTQTLRPTNGADPKMTLPTLSDDQIDELATQIVNIVKERGPFLSLSEFINRQLIPLSGSVNPDTPALSGVIQAALNMLEQNSSLNPYSHFDNIIENVTLPVGDAEYKFPEAALGSPFHGVPGWITQADILTPIAPVITARDDTFTIRAYGDSRDSSGNVVARAWCEATVQRTADFVDQVDSRDTRINMLTSSVNKVVGRRYKVLSFRWLNQNEI